MSRTPSQNVLFVGESQGDDEFEPPGRTIASQIASALGERGFSATEVDNWRDSGWSFEVTVEEARLEIVLAKTAEPQLWLLMVACISDPGFIGRLFGKPFTDRSREVLQVAVAVNAFLRESGFQNIRWCRDGYPDDAENTPHPVPPQESGQEDAD